MCKIQEIWDIDNLLLCIAIEIKLFFEMGKCQEAVFGRRVLLELRLALDTAAFVLIKRSERECTQSARYQLLRLVIIVLALPTKIAFQ
jgi:hypothetical protein